jgi:agarase
MLAQAPKTRWGGIADRRFQGSGFFRVEHSDGVFWLVDPDGGRFLSKGVNTVRFDQDEIRNSKRIPYADTCRRKYGEESVWRTAVAKRLAGWGVNTLGAWSDEAVAAAGRAPLALTPNLDLGMSFAWRKNEQADDRQHFPDVFDSDFDIYIRRRARERCTAHSGEQRIVGWFIDNELRWDPDWRGPDELLTLFLNLPPLTPGRTAAIAWLRERYQDFAKFNSSWHTRARSWDALNTVARIEAPYTRKPPYERDSQSEEQANRAQPARGVFMADCDSFASLMAMRYFELTAAAIKAADPNHLVLGCRFAYPPTRAVIDAAGRHLDVVSFNCYGLDPSPAIDAFAGTGKPCLIGEFAFRAADSGLPNSNGAGPLVATQTERAAAFRRYVTLALRKPTVVGYHWHENADQPAEGRFDGENSNYGTVTIKDEVYAELTQTMTAVNAEAEALHGLVPVA